MENLTNQPPTHHILLKGSDTWQEVAVGNTAVVSGIFLRFDSLPDWSGTMTVSLFDGSEFTLRCDHTIGLFGFRTNEAVFIKALRTEEGMDALFVSQAGKSILRLTHRNDVEPGLALEEFNASLTCQ